LPRLRIICLLIVLGLAGCKDSSGAAGDGGPAEESDAGVTEDSGAWVDASTPEDAAADATTDAAALVACPPESIVADGCQSLASASEGVADLCDGYDNDCDGEVDEGCSCVTGNVQECFAGPPGRADTGACQRGTQACTSDLEFAGWGPCERGISPQAELCDRLDNDCNGCIDERPDCARFIECPGENDSRLPKIKPFALTELDGADFYNGSDVARWSWTVEGSPCDQLFASIPGANASATSGRLSYSLTNANEQKAQVRFTLSGTYLVTLKIETHSGETLSCTFPLVVGAGGIRVELCWDKTGPTAGSKFVDLDLHLALKGKTSAFDFSDDAVPATTSKDFYAATFAAQTTLSPNGIWGHPPSPDVRGCLTGSRKTDPAPRTPALPGSADAIHDARNNCINPRLDLDNQGNTSTTRYLPENINLDNPRKGEIFQVAVNHVTPEATRVRARVNVYCGGKLRGTYEIDPAKTAFSDTPDGEHELWRVVEIAPRVSSQGVTSDCEVTPLTPPDAPQAPLITIDQSLITWSD
jgi:hypothetical protein